jgi:lysyl-tRNA synthetase class 2
VFEINRSFRNEGISVRHNPEFTMMEFYAAYWNYRDLMDFTETLLRDAAQKAVGTLQLTYGGKPVDLSQPFERLTIREAIVKHTDAGDNVDDRDWLSTPAAQARPERGEGPPAAPFAGQPAGAVLRGKVEEKLWQPTFIMEHPTEISPLARANDDRPEVTERFELYITGRELANGFSELNDAEDQAARFQAQVNAKEAATTKPCSSTTTSSARSSTACRPAGGCGIGIDRLMMLLTDSPEHPRRDPVPGPAPGILSMASAVGAADPRHRLRHLELRRVLPGRRRGPPAAAGRRGDHAAHGVFFNAEDRSTHFGRDAVALYLRASKAA